jgi:hypothetical protein
MPHLKTYLILCAGLYISGALCIGTGDHPVAVSCFVNNARLIVKA